MWFWILVSGLVGVCVGFLLCALCVIQKERTGYYGEKQ